MNDAKARRAATSSNESDPTEGPAVSPTARAVAPVAAVAGFAAIGVEGVPTIAFGISACASIRGGGAPAPRGTIEPAHAESVNPAVRTKTLDFMPIRRCPPISSWDRPI
jgi:hypothetical protein